MTAEVEFKTAGVTSGSTMVALYPDPADVHAAMIGLPDKHEDPATWHITLAYLGDASDPDDEPFDTESAHAAVERWAVSQAPLSGELAGVGRFVGNAEHGDPVWVHPDIPGLPEFRQSLVTMLKSGGLPVKDNHGYTPHVCVAYVPQGEPTPIEPNGSVPVRFTHVSVSVGDVAKHYRLAGHGPVLEGKVLDAPDPGRAVRDAHRQQHQAALDAYEKQLADGIVEFWDRQKATVLARLRGPKTRRIVAKGRKADPNYSLNSVKWTAEAIQFAIKMMAQIFGLSWKDTATRLGHPDIPEPDETTINADVSPYARRVVEALIAKQQKVKEAIEAAQGQGKTLEETAADVEDVYANSEVAAASIATSVSTGMANRAGMSVAREVGVMYKQWLSSHDSRVRDTHRIADGQEVAMDAKFAVGDGLLDHPGDFEGPIGEWINCFPDGTLVEADDIELGYSRWYDGDLVTVSTAGDHRLSGTPNHPVLTRRGWVGLGDLQPGDDLVRGVLRQDVLMGDPHVDRPPAAIEQVVDALRPEGTTVRRSGLGVDFHGDGRESEVEVVATDRLLQDWTETSADEPVRQDALTSTDLGAGLEAGDGLPLQFAVAGESAAPGLIGGSGVGAALLRRPRSGEYAVRVHAAARLDAALDETSNDDGSRSVHLASELSDAGTCEVSFDQVVDVNVTMFHGRVSNLQTARGYYIANGFIVRNCRCTMLYAFGDQPTGYAGHNWSEPLPVVPTTVSPLPRTVKAFEGLLLKAFNPAELRDAHGEWVRSVTASGSVRQGIGGETLKDLTAGAKAAGRSFTPAQRKAMDRWTSGRGGVRAMQSGSASAEQRQAFDEALKACPPVHGLVYRGVKGSAVDLQVDLQPGAVLSLGEMVSTSIDPGKAAAFSPNMYEIETRHAAYIAPLSGHAYEKEAVLPPGTFQVVSVERRNVRQAGTDRDALIVRLRDITPDGPRSFLPEGAGHDLAVKAAETRDDRFTQDLADPLGRFTPTGGVKGLAWIDEARGFHGRWTHGGGGHGDQHEFAAPKWQPVMSRDQADAWAKDSAIQQLGTFVGRAASIEKIRKEGFSLGRTSAGRVWGNGVYMGIAGLVAKPGHPGAEHRAWEDVKWRAYDKFVTDNPGADSAAQRRWGELYDQTHPEPVVSDPLHDPSVEMYARMKDDKFDWFALSRAENEWDNALEAAMARGVSMDDFERDHPRPQNADFALPSPRVLRLKVNVRNPAVIDAHGAGDTYGGDAQDLLGEQIPGYADMAHRLWEEDANGDGTGGDIDQVLTALGYDALIVHEGTPDNPTMTTSVGGPQVVVFDPRNVTVVDEPYRYTERPHKSLLDLAADFQSKAFNPAQPRDPETGRWVGGGLATVESYAALGTGDHAVRLRGRLFPIDYTAMPVGDGEVQIRADVKNPETGAVVHSVYGTVNAHTGESDLQDESSGLPAPQVEALHHHLAQVIGSPSHPHDALAEQAFPGAEWGTLKGHYNPMLSTPERATFREQIGDRKTYDDPGDPAKIEAAAKQKLAHAQVNIRLNPSALVGVLEAGRLKNQHETNSTGGYLDPHLRRLAEQTMFGYPFKAEPTAEDMELAQRRGMSMDTPRGGALNDAPQLPPGRWQPDSALPVYGYLTDPSETDPEPWSASAYGSVRLVLRPNLRHRTTFTGLDSLGMLAYPSAIDDPKAESFTGEQAKALSGRRGEPWKLSEGAYVEAQIHGGVKVSDIAEIHLSTSEGMAALFGGDALWERLPKDVKVYAPDGRLVLPREP